MLESRCMKYEMKCVSMELKAEEFIESGELESLPQWIQKNQGWIVSSNISKDKSEPAHISMQSNFIMKSLLSNLEELEYWQTDSVEGVID